jgi:hypothetical protein
VNNQECLDNDTNFKCVEILNIDTENVPDMLTYNPEVKEDQKINTYQIENSDDQPFMKVENPKKCKTLKD